MNASEAGDGPSGKKTRQDAATGTQSLRVAEMDVRMLELLVCPLTKGPLVWDAERSELRSRLGKLAYPVRDGIPILLPSEARTLGEDE